MNIFEGDSKSNQGNGEHIFDQFKSMITNKISTKDATSLEQRAIKMPVQLTQTISILHKQATFMALVDAMIPSTLGALDLRLDDYLVWSLDHFVSIAGEWGVKNIPLSTQTAEMLEIAAFQIIISGKMKIAPDFSTYPNGGLFSAISADDRFEALRLLENQEVDLEVLPSPYRNNIPLIKNIVTFLHQSIMFGYYSEWFTFGSSRLAYPEDRTIERPHFIWDTVKYPGISHGYRAIRGFLVNKFSE